MMLYRVYLWKRVTSQEAEIALAVHAASPDEALQAVMRAVDLAYANFAWVVPDDLNVASVQLRGVRCSSARRPGH